MRLYGKADAVWTALWFGYSGLLELILADDIQHFADVLHGLQQIALGMVHFYYLLDCVARDSRGWCVYLN